MKKLFTCLFAVCLLSRLAFADEDSCKAAIRWEPDANDPMLVHFCFNGVTPPGSFSYNCTWDFGDGNTSTDSFATHLYAQPGNYTVCLEFSICIGGGLSCHDDTCIDITVGSLSALSSAPGLSSFILYPNPAKDDLRIRIRTGSDPVKLSILNAAGIVIRKLEFTGNDAAVQVGDLPAGLYYVQLRVNGISLTRKISIGENRN